MMQVTEVSKSEVVIVGSGIAGIVAALELLENDQQCQITMIDRDEAKKMGGLARSAFGGMALIDTPEQQRMKIKDSPDIALKDWLSFAEFSESDYWPRRWAEFYVERSRRDVYDWMKAKGIHFIPAVNWTERGDYTPGNSVPRYHVIWGTSQHLVETLIQKLQNHPQQQRLQMLFRHRLDSLQVQQGKVTGIKGFDEHNQRDFEITCDRVIVATGGINGSLDRVRRVWSDAISPVPRAGKLLNGCHPYCDGRGHDAVTAVGGKVTRLEHMWNYAAGVAHTDPKFSEHGLSLIPPKTALWLDSSGKRIGPKPLITAFDTHDLCKAIAELPDQYSWQLLNLKICEKELAVSGAQHNPNIRDRNILAFIKDILLGNKWLAKEMIDHCPDFITGNNLAELVDNMNQLTGEDKVRLSDVRHAAEAWDHQINLPEKFQNDEQLRRIKHLRQWKGDKLRTCKKQTILDPKAGPLIAIRERIISRKSLGGIQTDLDSQVLNIQGQPIEGLYAVGEAAGFGGGGASGKRSLEGTFLSGCILTARQAAKHIVNSDLSERPINRQVSAEKELAAEI